MEETKDFLERFGNIQTSLKAPKNLRNTFGNYNYRNAEGILEAVKPYLKENRVILTLVDDVVAVGDRVFIKAEATVHDMDGEGYVTTTAFAQIDAHKGMSADQTTGCASSYARKYALNGLFLLDDTKDEDTDEFKKEQMAKGEAKPSAQRENSKEQEVNVTMDQLKKAMEDRGITEEEICKVYCVKSMAEFTQAKANNAMKHIDEIKAQAGGKKK